MTLLIIACALLYALAMVAVTLVWLLIVAVRSLHRLLTSRRRRG